MDRRALIADIWDKALAHSARRRRWLRLTGFAVFFVLAFIGFGVFNFSWIASALNH